MTDDPMFTEAYVIRRLQLAASSYRRKDSAAVADLLEAAVKYRQLSPVQREDAVARYPSLGMLITRLEKKGKGRPFALVMDVLWWDCV